MPHTCTSYPAYKGGGVVPRDLLEPHGVGNNTTNVKNMALPNL